MLLFVQTCIGDSLVSKVIKTKETCIQLTRDTGKAGCYSSNLKCVRNIQYTFSNTITKNVKIHIFLFTHQSFPSFDSFSVHI